jgi:hypothetical protein
MTSIRQLRIKASQIAIFGCKKNFFVVNKLEEFSLPAYLKIKALSQDLSGIYFICYSALVGGA